MQKVGLVKSKKNLSEFSTTIKEFKRIDLEDKEIGTISSAIIHCTIKNMNFDKNSSSLYLLLNISIKIIYSIDESNTLYVFEDNFLNLESINLPNKIEGYSSYSMYMNKKLLNEIFIENLDVKVVNNNILISYYLGIDVKINASHYIAFTIDNGFGENIFMSYSNGKGLTQRTFFNNIELLNIKFKPNSSDLLFLGKNNDNTNLYYISEDTKQPDKLIDFDNITNFLIDKNNIIFTNKTEDQEQIYEFNLANKRTKKLTSDKISTKNTNPYYDHNKKILYFLAFKEEKLMLYSMDKNNSIASIFEYENVLDYFVSYSGDSIIIKISRNDKIQLYTLDVDTNFLNPINLDFDFDDIINVKFIKDSTNKKEILIFYKENNISKLIKYDLIYFDIERISDNNFIIQDFDIDVDSSNIYICSKDNKFGYIQKINKNLETEMLLNTPSSINKITLRG
ncbi:TolB family protein [Romboutsia sp.]|uniref:TolB family protein n=1 Tax=Romboutsia sp. TaxID=1965302 RepID=UPI003F3D3C50